MKWDIDKDLAMYAIPGTLLDISVQRVSVDQSKWDELRVRPDKVDPTQQNVIAWCLAIGRFGGPKLFSHALTIREAHLRLRRSIKKLDVEGERIFGVKVKPKRKKFDRFKAMKARK